MSLTSNQNSPKRFTRPSILLSGVRTSIFQFFLHLFRSLRIPQYLGYLGAVLLLFLLSLAGCSKKSPEEQFAEHMKKAEQFKTEKKWEEARITLLSAIDAQPRSSKAYYELAEVLLQLQKFGGAVENYRTAINYDPENRDARLHLASLLLAFKEYELGESHIRKLLEKDPKDREALLLDANLRGIGPQKDYKGARAILKEIILAEPDNVVAIASLAQVSLLEGKMRQAEELFVKGLQLDPKNAPVRMALTDLYTRQGRLDEAQEIIENLLSDNPSNTSLRYYFSEFLLRRGLGEDALKQYEKTLETDPLRNLARDRLYDMYLTRQKKEQALALTSDLKKSHPDHPAVYYFEGRDLELDGKPQEALGKFIKAIEGMSNFAPPFRRAGLIEIALGQGQVGIEHLNQAVAIDGDDVGARLALGRFLFAKREMAQAKEHVRQILRRYPRQLGANILRADIALIEGELDEARKVYNFMIQAFPKSPVGYFKLGLLEERAGNEQEALKNYRATLDFDRGVLLPGRRLVALRAKIDGVEKAIAELESFRDKSQHYEPEYNFLMGALLLATRDRDRLEQARTLLNSALEERETLYGAYIALATIDSSRGDLEGAAQKYSKIVKEQPKHVPTRMLLALTREKQQKYDQAAEQYREILGISPRFAPASNNLAWLIATRLDGDLEEALKLAQSAKEQLPEEPSVADTLGWVYFRRGSPRAALPLLEDAIELNKGEDGKGAVNPEILYHLGEVRYALGDKRGARKVLRQALDLGGANLPDYDRVVQLLQEIG